ncbi:T9SS type A sorting domain-containing protein, partial [bacterium]|nr:T9SS type A sorting domain-containing protein [bacterium]
PWEEGHPFATSEDFAGFLAADTLVGGDIMLAWATPAGGDTLRAINISRFDSDWNAVLQPGADIVVASYSMDGNPPAIAFANDAEHNVWVAYGIDGEGLHVQRYDPYMNPESADPVVVAEVSSYDNLHLTRDNENGVWITFRRHHFNQFMVYHMDEDGEPASDVWESGPLPIVPDGTPQGILGCTVDERDGLLIALAVGRTSPTQGDGTEVVVQRIRDSIDNVKNREYGASLPETLRLTGAWPNPFNSELRLKFLLNAAVPLEVRVYDILGREVRTLTRGVFTAGQHSLHWDGRSNAQREVSSGVYFVELKTPGERLVQRVLLLR